MTMKKLITILAGVLAIGLTARGDSSAPTDFGTTTTVAAAATVTSGLGDGLDLDKWKDFALMCTFSGATSATNVGNIVITFARSIYDKDSSSAIWETTPQFTWTIPLNQSNTVVAFTNLGKDWVSGVRSIKPVSIQNTSAHAVTTNDVSSFKLLIVGKNRSE